jgi:hypothetical protein
VKWVKEGNNNISFSWESTLQHKNYKKNFTLKNEDGNTLEDQEDISQELTFFSKQSLNNDLYGCMGRDQ